MANRVKLKALRGALRAVQLPAETHTVAFEFRPPLVYLGGALSLLGLAALALLIWTQLRA